MNILTTEKKWAIVLTVLFVLIALAATIIIFLPLNLIEAKESDCYNGGNYAYYKNLFGLSFRDKSAMERVDESEFYTNPLGHDLSYCNSVLPTCTKNGTISHWQCLRCNRLFSDQNGVNEIFDIQDGVATGHSYNADNQCSICGDVLKYTQGLQYTLNNDNNSYSVSGIGSATDTDIVIPYYYEKKPVTSIGKEAFYFLSNEPMQFDLTIRSISMPESIRLIEEKAFAFCVSLESITIPQNVFSIASSAFEYCLGLKSIKVDVTNSTYKSENNCLLTKDGKKLIAGCKTSVIPNGVTSIEDFAFRGRLQNCDELTIKIPNGVTSIGANAFDDCTALVNVTIPNGVTYIGANAFDGCTALTKVTIPDSVTSIGEWAFSGCYSLKSVSIGKGVTDIKAYTFSYCKILTSITIPDRVIYIREWAFCGCEGLESVTMGSSVRCIDPEVFAFCDNLKSVQFKVADGWYVMGPDGGVKVDHIDFSDPSTAAIDLLHSYSSEYLRNTNSVIIDGKESWVQ